MITLDFSFGVALYIALALIIILAAWVFGKKKAKDSNLSLDSRFIWFCCVCTYTYINTKEDDISKCPRCGSYNKK